MIRQDCLGKLKTCHEDLQKLFDEVSKTRDFLVLYGFRNENEQNSLWAQKKSKLKWPTSYHNQTPSMAVDVVPFPVPDWKNLKPFQDFMEFVKQTARELEIDIQCGGEWPRFRDYPHYQLKVANLKK